MGTLTNFRAEDFKAQRSGTGEQSKPAKKAAAPAASERPKQADVPEGTAQEVLEWVGDDKARAQKALAVEQKNESPRKSVVGPLEKIIEADDES